ncbi:MAG: hypothetical protein AAI946_00775 [Candidatus Hodgkinia cicadicola]
MSWVLALCAVQVLDRAFLDDAEYGDYVRARRLFVWQFFLVSAHVLDELMPYLHYDLCNWAKFKTTVAVLYSREGAKASWLLVNLIACITLTNAITRLVQHKPLLLVATLALANASIAYFVKSVVVDLTHFETLATNFSFAVLAHPLLIYAGHAAYGFNAFFCAVYKTVPSRRELCSKLIDLTSRLSTVLLSIGATLGAYCNYSRGLRAWCWDHIECNAILFSALNLLTVHLNKLGGGPRDSILGYQLLACPLSIAMTYAIHHDLIPTSHGIEGPLGRGGVLAWILCILSAVFTLTLLRSVWECVRALNAAKHAPPYGLALACVLFVIVIMALLAFAIFASSRLGVISASVVVVSAWFGISVLAFDLCYNKHSFALAVLVTTVLMHVLVHRRHALIERVAVGYYGMLALKHLFRALFSARINILADICHLSALCALTCASLSQVGATRARISLFHALAAVKLLAARVSAFRLNAAVGVASPRNSYAHNGHIVVFRTPNATTLSSLLFNVASILLLLTQTKAWTG